MIKIQNFTATLMALLIVYLLAGHIYIVLDSNFFLTTHLTLEVASVIIAILVSIFCWYDYRYQQKQKMLILAFTFCIMGMLDFVHSLSYHLLDRIWETTFQGDDNTVNVHIRRLREKIEDIPSKPRYIKTVWGTGYKFVD